MSSVGIVAIGSSLGPNVIDNDTVAAWTGVDAERILERTGYVARSTVAPGMATSDLAHAAVLDLVAHDPTALDRIGTLIVATSTPDYPQPPTAALIQDRFDALRGVPAFDLNAVCTGWLFGVVTGAGLVDHDADRGVLVVGADVYSQLMDRHDYATVSLFGDGAAASVLRPVPDGYGLLAHKLVTDGHLHDLVKVHGGGSRHPLTADSLAEGAHLFRMRGKLVKGYVLDTLPRLVRDVVKAAGVGLADIDRFVFHQANPRLLGLVADALGLDTQRVVITPRYGNCGAASMPIALHETHRQHALQRDELVLLAGVGGSMSVGGAVMRWW